MSILTARMTHLGLACFDRDAMEIFYRRTIGMVVTDRGTASGGGPEIVFMSADPNEHHQLVLAPGRPEGSPSIIGQISFLVDDLAALRAHYERNKAFGAVKLMTKNHGNSYSIYFMDPEGNKVEIYCHTPWYVSQPHNTPLDFSLSDDEILALTEELVRNDPTFKPRAEWQAELAERIARGE